jgi:DNA-binding MarR family transcriptional regulator
MLSMAELDEVALLIADVYEAAGVLRRWGERIAATEGQTQARWQLMSAVSEGDWTVPAAAERLGTSRQAVQRIANELVEDGLVEFAANPRHRRSMLLRLTPGGRQVLAAINRRAARHHRAVTGALAAAELMHARAELRRLVDAVRCDLDAPETGA